jgi:hypothetical protein
VKSDKYDAIGAWLMRSGYALEMRVAAACRSNGLPSIQSFPYQDPMVPATTREADVVTEFQSGINNPQGSCSVLTVIECKFPKGKPWVAILLSDLKVDGLNFTASQLDSEPLLRRLRNVWAGFSPFGKASYADSLVSAHVSNEERERTQGPKRNQGSEHNDAGSALRQAMSAASGIQQKYVLPTERHVMITLPVLVTGGELVSATLNSTGDIEVDDVSNVFVATPRPGGSSLGTVRVMTVDYFTESFAPGLAAARRTNIW